jgi:hypothetical protein
MTTITPAGDAAPDRRRSRVLSAHASIYAPCRGRQWWWIAYICPHCGCGHLGRSRTEDEVTGVRKTRCGLRVRVRVARTYRGREVA